MSVTIQFINTGSSANAGNGDSLRTAFNKINGNFLALSTQTGGTGTTVLSIASTSTLGGIKIGTGLVIAGDGVLSVNTGTSAAQVTTLLDQHNDPRIDVVTYTGTATLGVSSVNLFSFDKTIYRGASLDILAKNIFNVTTDVATGYGVTWVAYASKVFGMGPIAMDNSGVTRNAEWDLTAVTSGTNIEINMVNVAGVLANGHTVNWTAKVSLFRA
jgi:hypothetical protein